MNPDLIAQRLHQHAEKILVVQPAPCKTCGDNLAPKLHAGDTCSTCGHTRRKAANSKPEATPCPKCKLALAPHVESGNECQTCGVKSRKPRYKDASTGKGIAGVTTILDIISKPALVPWAARCTTEHIEAILANGGTITDQVLADARNAHRTKRDEGAHIGRQVHDALQAWVEGGVFDGYFPDDPQADKAVRAGLAFLDKIKPHIIAVEAICVDPENDPPRWCGRVDIVYYDPQAGGLVVLDWKSTKSGLYAESFMQVGAYAESVAAAAQVPVVRTELVHVDRESGGFRVATRWDRDLIVDRDDFNELVRIRANQAERQRVIDLVMKMDPITSQDQEEVA